MSRWVFTAKALAYKFTGPICVALAALLPAAAKGITGTAQSTYSRIDGDMHQTLTSKGFSKEACNAVDMFVTQILLNGMLEQLGGNNLPTNYIVSNYCGQVGANPHLICFDNLKVNIQHPETPEGRFGFTVDEPGQAMACYSFPKSEL